MKPFLARAVLLACALCMTATACSKSSNPSSGAAPAAPSSVAPAPSPSPSEEASAGTMVIDGENATSKGSEDLSGKSTFTLNLDNDNGQFYFEPTVLKGTPGEKISLVLKNVGETKHNFTLDAQHINQDVNTPGTSSTITVTFPQSGSLQFHCEYHESLGMIGELSS